MRNKYIITIGLAAFFLFAFFHHGFAQTFVSGDVSGTWTSAKSPYIVNNNCTVPDGQVLAIEPGVEVIIGDSLGITVLGQIIAVGTPEQPIEFKSPNDTIYWNRISVQYRAGNEKSRFQFCDIRNARCGIQLYIGAINAVMDTEILNCTFKSCVDAAIYGESQGWTTGFPFSPLEPSLNPTLMNCVFDSCGNGILFKIHGRGHQTGGGGFIRAYGFASPTIINNIFSNLNGTAFKMSKGNYAGASNPVFKNNTIVNCFRGISAQEPYDAEIQNNIFYKTKIALERTGDLSSKVGYNCFFENDSADAIGYADIGNIVWKNRNGVDADLTFNIFQEPNFANSENYQLADNSPCIDAGEDDSSNFEICFPPSKGKEMPDIGAYGGAGACGWPNLTVGIAENEHLQPTDFILGHSYPNPFNPTTKINYRLAKSGKVKLVIFNTLGQKVRTLVDAHQPAGSKTVVWNGRDDFGSIVSSGTYIYSLQVDGRKQERKMTFIK